VHKSGDIGILATSTGFTATALYCTGGNCFMGPGTIMIFPLLGKGEEVNQVFIMCINLFSVIPVWSSKPLRRLIVWPSLDKLL
jgi:hypothetical protein